MNIDRPIAIIDSGIGGLSVLKQLIDKYKYGQYVYFADNKFMPYGNKSKDFVKNRILEIIEFLRKEYKVKKILIACNTASSCLYGIKDKDVKILTFNKEKTYLTTKLTKENLKGYKVISSNNLANLIEKNINKPQNLDKIVKRTINDLELCKLSNLVLGCTHYELVADVFKKYCLNTKITLNSCNLINRVKVDKSDEVKLTLILSDNNKKYRTKIFKLLNIINYN